ncbi:hypothetical protein Tco_0012901 [Tanacetum coccineum]
MTNTIVTTLVNVTGTPVTNTVANHAEKPKKFNGQNFKRWQQKMFFYLTTLNLARFLNETAPQVEPPKEVQPSNSQTTTAKELWESRKYKTEDAELLKEKNRALEDMVNAMFLSPGLSYGIKSSRIDDKIVQDQRQRDDNDLQDERQDQPKKEKVEPRRSKRARTKKSFGPDFVSFMVENEPTSYREAITSSEWLNRKNPLKVK